MTGPHCLEAQECRGDFWNTLETAMGECGGGFPIERIAKMSLEDVVEVLAQNGIRMVYIEGAKISKARQATTAS